MGEMGMEMGMWGMESPICWGSCGGEADKTGQEPGHRKPAILADSPQTARRLLCHNNTNPSIYPALFPFLLPPFPILAAPLTGPTFSPSYRPHFSFLMRRLSVRLAVQRGFHHGRPGHEASWQRRAGSHALREPRALGPTPRLVRDEAMPLVAHSADRGRLQREGRARGHGHYAAVDPAFAGRHFDAEPPGGADVEALGYVRAAALALLHAFHS